MPPGPWGFPFLGVGHKLNKNAPHFTYTEWNRKYGDIISLTLFGEYYPTHENLKSFPSVVSVPCTI